MPRGLGAWGALLGGVLLCLAASEVRAHGAPPAVLDVLSADARGPVTLRLNVGIARRRDDGRFDFTCPAAWDEDVVRSTALLADGRLLVAALRGVLLLTPGGEVVPHPDANASGFFTQLVATAHAVYGLRLGQLGSELVRIDAREARTIWTAPLTWLSLAAGDERLVLQRAEGPLLEQLTLAEDGSERAETSAVMEAPVDYVFARTDGDVSYALVVTQGRPRLGVLEADGYRTVAEGVSSIVGPAASGEGALVAVDGQLQQLRAGALEPTASTAYVTCLTRAAGRLYGCAPSELLALDAAGQGTRAFSFEALAPPQFDALPQAQRARCQYQWDDLRVDLLAMGVEVPEPEDAGVPVDAALADGAAPDAGDRPERQASGCSAQGASSARAWPLTLLGCAALLAQRSRRRGCASTRR